MVAAVDSSGNGNDGTYTDITGNPWRAGLVAGNGAVNFGLFGDDRVGSVETPPPLVDFSTSWTIACLYANPIPGDAEGRPYIATSGGGPRLEFIARDGAGRPLVVTTGFQTWDTDFDVIPADGLPHLVAFTFEKSPSLGVLDTGTFYVDGVTVANANEPISVVPDTFFTEAEIFAQAIFDEWACWNRVLSSGEVASLQSARGSFAAYNSAVLALSPTAYYHLDEFPPPSSGWHVGRIGMGA